MKKFFFTTFLFCYFFSTALFSGWQSLNGPYGSNITCSLIIPGNVLLAGTDYNGLLKSADGGETWESLLEQIPERTIFALSLDSSGCIWANTNSGVYKFSGDTWKKVYMTKASSMMVYTNGNVFIGIERNTGLLKSSDGGESWTDCSVFAGTNEITIMACGANGDILAGTRGMPVFGEDYFICSIFISSDIGASWQKIISLKGIYVTAIALDKNGVALAGSSFGLYRSTKPYTKWDSLDVGLGYPLGSTLDRNGNFICSFYNDNVIISEDGGMTWEKLADHKIKSVGDGIKLDENGNLYFASYGKGILMHEEFNKRFSVVGNNLTRLTVLSLAKDKDNRLVAGTDKQGIYLSTDDGASWSHSETDFEPYIGHIFCDYEGRYWASAHYSQLSNSNLYFSDDKGVGWTKVDFFQNNKVAKIFETKNNTLLASSSNGLFASTDGGASWAKTGNGLESNIISCFAENNLGQIFAGTSLNGIYMSDNNGSDWTCINTNDIDTLAIRGIACYDEGTVIAAPLYGGVYLSHNYGATWSKLSNGFSGKYPVSIELDNSGNAYVIDFYKGIFKSSDKGFNWENIIPREDSKSDIMCGLLLNDKTFIASMPYKGGLFRSNVGSSVQDGDLFAEILPYPNPAKEYVLIFLTEGAKFDEYIELFDVSCRAVARVKSRPGKNTILLDGLPPGLYYVKSGDYTAKFVKL